MDGLKEKILNTYESKLKKGVKYFTKKQKKKYFILGEISFHIGKDVKKPQKSGKKKTIGILIPVQQQKVDESTSIVGGLPKQKKTKNKSIKLSQNKEIM